MANKVLLLYLRELLTEVVPFFLMCLLLYFARDLVRNSELKLFVIRVIYWVGPKLYSKHINQKYKVLLIFISCIRDRDIIDIILNLLTTHYYNFCVT